MMTSVFCSSKGIAALTFSLFTATVGAAPIPDSGEYNGHWYELIRPSATWNDAKLAAEGMDSPDPGACPVKGHLVTIMDENENAFVRDISKGILAWIGYHQPSTVAQAVGPDEGGWEWVTGEVSPTSYDKWDTAGGQPSNSGGNQDAAYINYNTVQGTWDDTYSGNLLGYVVEWDCPLPTTTATATASGDPHFVTWQGEKYDYMGECLMELASDPTFADGKGLDVHIMTKIRRNWSYIKSAAIRIGHDILEVMGGTDGNHYWFNYKYQGELTSMGNLPVTFSYPNKKGKSRSYIIDLGEEDKIEIKTYKEFVRVNFYKPRKELYGNTVGLLGDFTTGKKLARDGVTEIKDYNEFGQEWQVMPGALMLFHEISGPQTPFQQCIMPNKNAAAKKHRRHRHRHRRLGKAGGEVFEEVTEAQAKFACEKAGVSTEELDSCIYDVMATDDLDMAGSY